MKKFLRFSLAVFIAFILPAIGHAQTIITVAGAGVAGKTGDGGYAVNAQLHYPTSVALSDSGVLYIADALNNQVRKIKGGIITLVAGTGFESGTGYGAFGGDGAAATAAWLYFPSGVALDRKGNVYIADQNNNRIRKVDTGGIITTVAGTGVAGYTGDASLAVIAQLTAPCRIAFDTLGQMFIADAGNNCIRKIDTLGFISTIAGTGTAGFVGDGGLAVTAILNNPTDVVVNDSGYVFIADAFNNRIRKIDRLGYISTIVGNGIGGFVGDGGPASASCIYEPSGLALDDSGNLYISQLGDSRIRVVNSRDTIYSVAGTDNAGFNGDYLPALSASLWFPQGLALNSNRNLYIADQGNNRVRFISTTLGVNNVSRNSAVVNIFPNPGDGAFTIKVTSSFTERATVSVMNTAGEKVSQMELMTNTSAPMNFEQPAGMYFITTSTAHGSQTDRLIVK